MATERTVNPYQTYGPADTGESWHEYFVRQRGIRSASGGDVEPSDSDQSGLGDDLGELGQLVGSELCGPDVCGPGASSVSLVRYQKQLVDAGFQIKNGWYSYFHEGRIYGDAAAKAGEKAPDRTIDTAWLTAYKPGRLMKIAFERVNGGKWKCVWRQINLQLRPVSDAELKEWINASTTNS